jgi:hypothetical protein
MPLEYRKENFAEVVSGIFYSSSQHLAGCVEEGHKNPSKAGTLAETRILKLKKVQDDSKLLSEFSWSINRNPDNNLESSCISEVILHG